MPTMDWLKKEFYYGYDSGNVLSVVPGPRRFLEEKKIGGSYKKVFSNAVRPYLKSDSRVLELGPGKGAWSRAILKYITDGELHTVDFQDVAPWLKPDKYDGRLVCHKVDDNSFGCLQDNYFDFFWSMGVLCHNNGDDIKKILENSLSKMKLGAVAVHQYGDWEKLEAYGWSKGAIPLEFKDMPDEDIWWPRNTQDKMASIAESAGWTVVNVDLGLVKRDSIIVLERRS